MEPDRDVEGAVGYVALIVAALIPIATLVYSLQLLPRIGIIIYQEQYLALFLSLCVALTFLRKPAWRSHEGPAPFYDIIAAGLSLGLGLYVFATYGDIVRALGRLTPEMITISAIGLVLLFEAARRQAGLVMVVIGGIAIAYSFFGHHLDGMFQTRRIRFDRILTYNYLGTGAVFGTPLFVAATIVASFVVFGRILFLVGGGKAISDFAFAFMGHRRGGPAKVAIVSSALFGSLSGSASANVATTGILTIPMMRRVGYDPARSGAIEAVASTGGLVLPPVMAATGFLMAEFLGVPYAEVALAALIPALLFYLCVYLQVDLEALKAGLRGAEREELPDMRAATWAVIPVLLPFGVLLYALFGLNWNAAAAAFCATGATLLLSFVVPSMRQTPAGYLQAVVKAGEATVFVAVLCAIAGVVVGSLGLTGLGSRLAQNLVDVSGGSLPLLLLLAAFGCIVLGMGVPVTATYIILIILIGPALQEVGVPAIAAHMFVFYYGTLSFLTPPVCLSVFVAASIARSPPMRTAMHALRFAIGAYLLPFVFVIHPEFLMQGALAEVAFAVTCGVIGVGLISIGLVGYFVGRLPLVLRLLALTVGIGVLFLFKLHWGVPLAAAVMLAMLYLHQMRGARAVQVGDG